MNWPILLLPLLAYWSVWNDYAQRVWSDPQLAGHPLAAMAGMWVLWSKGRTERRAGPFGVPAAFTVALLCALLYAPLYSRLSWMPRYALALQGFGTCLCWMRASQRPWLGLGFMVLGIPMLSQLEQLIGADVRLSVAEAAAALVRVSGWSVFAHGTRLEWAGGAVDVDAPCSGLRMLWTGVFVLLLALAHFRLPIRSALALTLATPLLIWLGNVLRCAALFYVESGLVIAPSWVHPGVGLIVFCGLCCALWEGARWLAKSEAERERSAPRGGVDPGDLSATGEAKNTGIVCAR